MNQVHIIKIIFFILPNVLMQPLMILYYLLIQVINYLVIQFATACFSFVTIDIDVNKKNCSLMQNIYLQFHIVAKHICYNSVCILIIANSNVLCAYLSAGVGLYLWLAYWAGIRVGSEHRGQ